MVHLIIVVSIEELDQVEDAAEQGGSGLLSLHKDEEVQKLCEELLVVHENVLIG